MNRNSISTNHLGRLGEEIAAKFLISKGYYIRQHNYRFRRFEVDLIVENSEFVVFVEVKTRSSVAFGRPENFVSSSQQLRLIEASNSYYTEYQLTKNVRFDVLAINFSYGKPEVSHFEDAFWSVP